MLPPRPRFQRTVLALLALTFFFTNCQTAPRLVEYQTFPPLELDAVPVVLVGQIVNQVDVGRPHPARFDREQPMQLRRVTVKVEKVLRGDVRASTLPIYYFISLRAGGPPILGMFDNGGRWHIGDHVIWFLRRDSGVLRTMEDTWARTMVTVLTGPHATYKPGTNEPLSHQVIDIMLQPADVYDYDQWALAILNSSMHASAFDAAYTVTKLRKIAGTYPSGVREAALGELQSFSCDGPEFQKAAEGLCLGTK